MPQRKLKVRRREEPTQVSEPRSSWLQLQKEKAEVKRYSQRDGGWRCHDTEKESGDMRGKTQKRVRKIKEGLREKDTPHPHLLGLPGCEGLVFQAPLFMRKTPGSSQINADTPLHHPGPIFSLMLLPAEAIWGGSSLGRHFPLLKQEPCVDPLRCLERASGPKANKD